jgi:hypothetical protein
MGVVLTPLLWRAADTRPEQADLTVSALAKNMGTHSTRTAERLHDLNAGFACMHTLRISEAQCVAAVP